MRENCISDFAEAKAVFMLPSTIKEVMDNNFSIYPNPTKNTINIVSNENINLINVLDNKGSLIFSQSFNENNISINVSDFSKGIYLVNIISLENSSSHKIIIE
tara:strand:- start:197 stop:505 length:309 start_codon:yes stop_codon:yes gene_type:complete